MLVFVIAFAAGGHSRTHANGLQAEVGAPVTILAMARSSSWQDEEKNLTSISAHSQGIDVEVQSLQSVCVKSAAGLCVSIRTQKLFPWLRTEE